MRGLGSTRMGLAALAVLLGAGFALGYSGGDGLSEATAYRISTPADWVQLMNTPAHWTGKYFELTQDINLAGVTVTPVGGIGVGTFKSDFNGGGHTLHNVVIDLPNKSYVGLFGYLASGGKIRNLQVANADVRGSAYVGILAGLVVSGTIDSCTAAGTVQGGNHVGGLTGINDRGTQTGCQAAANVTGSYYVGGLTGSNDSGTIHSCRASGAVYGIGTVGGLVGTSKFSYGGSIIDCEADGNVTGSGDNIGGLAGVIQSGGLTALSSCHATGTVRGGSYVGGLVGRNENSPIRSCSATGDVIATGNCIGGLAGYNYYNTIQDCRAEGTVSGNGAVGGLVGKNYHEGIIVFCHAAGAVSGTEAVGGLVGENYRSVTSCCASGAVSGQTGVGGVAGRICDYTGRLTTCCATGAVSGNSEVGGLAGYSHYGAINGCFAAGAVSGTTYVGGLAGLDENSTFNSCLWDTQSSGTADGVGSANPDPQGATGKTTAEMKTQSTFTNAGWDFAGTWFLPYHQYPRLRWQAVYSGGSGTQADPYRIGSVQDLYDLMGLSDQWGACFLLTADLDLSGETFDNALIAPDTSLLIGYQGTVFCGVFDGGGHVIRNLRINGTSEYVGLFGFVGETASRGRAGIIRSLGLVDAYVKGSGCVGGIVGKLNHGSIRGCFTTGQVRASYLYAGGLVGYNGSGSDLSLYSGQISDCYSRCRVLGSDSVGGLAGFNFKSEISHCYSTGEISGLTNAGGLVGAAVTGAGYEDGANFWDTETSKTTLSAMGTGLVTKGMKALSVYSDVRWDLVDTWAICSETNYPRLAWQIPATDWVCPDGVATEDLAYLLMRWLESDCGVTGGCQGADLDVSGEVNMVDIAAFAAQWMQGVDK